MLCLDGDLTYQSKHCIIENHFHIGVTINMQSDSWDWVAYAKMNRIDEFFIAIFVYENAFEAMCHSINCLHNTSTASQELLQAIIYLSLLFQSKKVHEKGIISYAYNINFCKPVCKYEEELAVHLRIGIGRMWYVFHGTHAYASCFGSRLITLFIGRWFSLPNIMELVLQFILSRTVAIHAIGIRSR